MSTLPNRLTRRRWLAASAGLIVLTPEFILSLVAEIHPAAPALAADLYAWLKSQGGEL